MRYTRHELNMRQFTGESCIGMTDQAEPVSLYIQNFDKNLCCSMFEHLLKHGVTINMPTDE